MRQRIVQCVVRDKKKSVDNVRLKQDVASKLEPNFVNHSFITSLNTSTHDDAQANTQIRGIGDSGCTGHYLAVRDRAALEDIVPCTEANRIRVQMPNKTYSTSTHIGYLRLPHLPRAACLAYLFEDQQAKPLIAIGVLCDHGMTCVLNADRLSVLRGKDEVLFGLRNHNSGLWEIGLDTVGAAPDTQCSATAMQSSANVIRNTTDHELMAFYHQMLFSPTMSTMQKAADAGLLAFLPGFTADKLRKNPIHTLNTAKGHLDRVRQGQNSTHRTETRKQRETRAAIEDHDSFPHQIEVERNQLYVHMSALHNYTEHMDATGKFMLQNKAKNWYILIIFNKDANYIHLEVMKSRTAEAYRAAVKQSNEFFADRGCTPAYTWLDNETSALLKEHFAAVDITPNYVTRGNHRANRAERCVRTAKNHLIAGLASVDEGFPAEAWDELIPQCEITLNVLRMSRITPNISAFHQLCGQYDYAAHPMGPPGIAVAIYVGSAERSSFQDHADAGFYVGAALEHYRSFRVWATQTQAVRITDTLDWFPKDVVMPGASPAEQLTAALRDVHSAVDRYLKYSPATETAQPEGEESQRAVLRRVMDAFARPTDTAQNDAPRALPQPPTGAARAPPGLPPPKHVYLRPGTEGGTAPTQQQQHVPAVPVVPAVPPGSEGGRPSAPAAQPATAVQAPHNAPVATAATHAKPVASGPFNAVLAERKRLTKRRAAAKRSEKKQTAKAAAAAQELAQTHLAYNAAHVTCEDLGTPDAIGHWFKHYSVQAGVTNYSRGSWGEHFANSATDDLTGKPLRLRALRAGPDAAIWIQASREEFVRLMRETRTMHPCHPSAKPAGQIASYYNQVCSVKIKKEQRVARVRGTFGGEVINYDGETTALTAALTTVKILAADIISDPTALAMVLDLQDFYLMSDLLHPEYMWINLCDIPEDVQIEFNIAAYAVNGRVMMEVVKGLYGLPQAGFLAQKELEAHVAKFGYRQVETPCLYEHDTNGNRFALVVDDFLVKIKSEAGAQHIIAALQERYVITIDRTASKYIGITMHWHYEEDRRVEFDMHDATQKALARFDVVKAKKDTLAPNTYIQPVYSKGRQQQTDGPDESPRLDAAGTKHIQSLIGCFQYIGRCVDSTMLVKLGQLASQQSRATQQTLEEANLFLQYVATWPSATVTIRPCDMILKIHSDASYLSEPDAGSRIGGYFYLGNKGDDDSTPNGAILVLSVRLDVVVSSVAEAEYGGCFHNAREGEPLRRTLEDLGYPQPATVITTDNKCAENLANNTCKQKRSKATDMRYHWIRDRIRQGHYVVRWEPGRDNLADFFTKLHPPKYHRENRKLYVSDPRRSAAPTTDQQRKLGNIALKPTLAQL